MKKALIPLAMMIATSQANAQDEEKRYSLTLTDPDAPMYLEVDMHNGSVSVTGYDGKTVEILATMSPLSENDEREARKLRRKAKRDDDDKPRQRNMDGLKPVKNVVFNLEIKESNNRVEIENELSLYHVDVEVKVPRNASVDAELYRGKGITLKDLNGELELQTFKGDIVAHNISGPIVAETHTDDIVVTFSSLSEKSPSSLTTYSGDVDITLEGSIATSLHVKNFQGEILSGLDAPFAASEIVNRKDKGNRQQISIGGQVSAQVNGGGQDLSINTYNGDVYLRKP